MPSKTISGRDLLSSRAIDGAPASGRQSTARAYLQRSAPLLPLLLLFTFACDEGPEANTPDSFPVPVEMATAGVKPLRDVLSLVGTLDADESVLLKPEVSGKIAVINFREGQKVAEGTLLIQLDDRETAAALKESEADLAFARAEYARRQNLFKQRVVSRQELERARAEMNRIAAHVDLMKARLRKTKIRAPFSGTVGARQVSPGDFVESGDTIANFESINPLKLNFEVPERYVPRLDLDLTVDLKVVAYPDREFRGVVYFIDPRVSRANRSVRVKATVPNPDGLLRPGMFANVALLVEEKLSAITIPEQALIPQGDERFVFRVKPDSTVDLVPVTTGIRSAGTVEITSGILKGDTVVVAGHQKLGPGSKVVPFGQPPPGAPAPDSDQPSEGNDGGRT